MRLDWLPNRGVLFDKMWTTNSQFYGHAYSGTMPCPSRYVKLYFSVKWVGSSKPTEPPQPMGIVGRGKHLILCVLKLKA